MLTQALPTSRRPGRYSPARRLVMEALADGQRRDGIAATPAEARAFVSRLHAAARRCDARVRASYEDKPDGTSHWYAVVVPEAAYGVEGRNIGAT